MPFSGPFAGLYAAQTGRGIQGHRDGGKGHTGPLNSRHGKPLPVEPVKLPGRSFSWAFRGSVPGRGPLFPCCREQIGREREPVEVYWGPGDMGPGPGRG